MTMKAVNNIFNKTLKKNIWLKRLSPCKIQEKINIYCYGLENEKVQDTVSPGA